MVKRIARIVLMLIVAVSGLALSTQPGQAAPLVGARSAADPPAWIWNRTDYNITAATVNEGDHGDCPVWNGVEGGDQVSSYIFWECAPFNIGPHTDSGLWDDPDVFKPGPDYPKGSYQVRVNWGPWRWQSRMIYTRIASLQTAKCTTTADGYLRCDVVYV
ncbi:hypothetical protein HD597_000517 [Nonomuraea thailandensis]|uniref:Uncharacterized protein n=1 Tax=Nonomuraea thailandensis TaxID=1188745 RepID=A0A9X2JXV6_9ACTN|nr:hypothetical protein [Nonomuraea thailandensis]MCP2353497.1 hypothetical protein [Nonomuraea thailandensis]